MTSADMKSTDSRGGDPAKRLRLIIISVVVLAVLGFALALYLAIEKEGQQERWDVFEQLRKDGEPTQDPVWENPYSVYNPERAAYVRKLELFLESKAKDGDDALEPHTRYLIAKTLADHILSNPGILDQKERGAFYEKAVAQLETIRDSHPDFPINWTMLSDEGFPSLTRQFIQWLKDNQAWEKENMLRPRDVADSVRVLLRTTRGDMLLGVYTEDAPTWTTAFLERAVNGFYDGTMFVSKRAIGDISQPEEHSMRAAGSLSRGLQAFDQDGHKKATEVASRSAMLPDEARNRIPHTRGTICAWHAGSDEYDNGEQFILLARDSPLLDYKFTPVGKMLDEQGISSFATLDEIFGGTTWSEDKSVRDDTDLRSLLDWFRAPVEIVKVLVYENGTLKEPTGGALPTKAKTEASESTLASLKADRYKADAPNPPADDDTPPKKDGDDPKDGEKK